MSEAATPNFVEFGLGPVPYYFNVTGPQAGQALQKDAAVQRLRSFRNQPATPGYRELLEKFKASPASGCVTVLDQLRRRAGYIAAHPNPYTLTMFYAYLKQHPLFAELPFDGFQFEIKVGMGQPTPNPDAVVKRFQASDAEAGRRIRQQYDSTIQRALENRGKTQESDLLQEHSLGVRDRITFLYVHTTLQAHLDMLPPFTVIGEIIGTRYGMEFAFDAAKWPSYAEEVLQEDLKTLDEWLNGL